MQEPGDRPIFLVSDGRNFVPGQWTAPRPSPDCSATSVICPAVAARQAAAAGHDERDELGILLTHGILHLLGYDHAEPDEERLMFCLQGQLVAEMAPAPGSGRLRHDSPARIEGRAAARDFGRQISDRRPVELIHCAPRSSSSPRWSWSAHRAGATKVSRARGRRNSCRLGSGARDRLMIVVSDRSSGTSMSCSSHELYLRDVRCRPGDYRVHFIFFLIRRPARIVVAV